MTHYLIVLWNGRGDNQSPYQSPYQISSDKATVFERIVAKWIR